ncbi:unnamed protein product, partial [Ectocarpus fasciculatus]
LVRSSPQTPPPLAVAFAALCRRVQQSGRGMQPGRLHRYHLLPDFPLLLEQLARLALDVYAVDLSQVVDTTVEHSVQQYHTCIPCSVHTACCRHAVMPVCALREERQRRPLR